MTEKGVILIPEPFPERSLRVVPPHYEIRQGNAERRYREDELIDALQDVCALAITSRERITARVIDNAPALRVIGKSGARPTNVDADAALRRGIELVWSPYANVQSVAEMTLALMLLVVKRIPEVVERLRGGGWRSYEILGRELSSMTVGLVGLGNVGLAVARMLRAIGARVVGFDPGVPREKAAEQGVEWLELAEVFARSEVVSLHCELNEETHAMIGSEAFAAMREGVYLVNTARGPLVDAQALLAALASGRVAAAAVDVFTSEPVPAGDPLVGHPRIVATPHVSAFTTEAIHRETSQVLEDIVNVLSNRPVVHMGRDMQGRVAAVKETRS